jgi:hypothetical protein
MIAKRRCGIKLGPARLPGVRCSWYFLHWEGPKKQKSEHDVDTYSIVFLALAVFFFLVRSVLRQRTGSERPPVTDTFFYRLSMISVVLAAVLYVANKSQLHSVLEAALTPVAAPIVVAPIVAAPSAPVTDSVPIYPTNNGTSAMLDVVLGGQPLRMLLDTGAQRA